MLDNVNSIISSKKDKIADSLTSSFKSDMPIR